MIPSAYKDGKLYSIKPTDGSGDFTFTRGSNLAATRVDVNGLIEKGRENLYLHSNNFGDAEWDVKSGTFTQGVSDPNGGSNAWSWTSTNTAPYLYQRLTPYSGISCLSIWVKGVGSTIGANFQIRGGSGNPLKTITLTSDWQRVQHYGDYSANPFVGFEFGIPAVTGDVVHIYQAQYEQGLVATDYIETTTTTAQAGILEDMPRLDYSGGASCPSLLLEPQRTNAITQSEYFQNYSISRQTLVHNSTASPEGLINATELNDTAVSGTHFIQLKSGVTNGGVLSFFAKQNTHRYVQAGPSSSISKRVFFDLQDGVMATIGNSAESYYGIEDYGNGWYRCYIAFGNLESPSIFNAAGDGSNFNHNNYTGDGSGVYIYGAQIEQDVSYHTSYIPTYGTSVTRSFDNGDVFNTNSFGTDGQDVTYFFEFVNNTEISRDSASTSIRVNNSASNLGSFRIYRSSSSDYRLAVVLQDINGNFSPSGATTSTDNAKVLIKRVWDTGLIDVFVNGVKENSGTSLLFNEWSKIEIEGTGSTINVNQALVFPTALTDSECIALTTL